MENRFHNQPLWKREKLAMSVLVTLEIYQPVLPNTMHTLSARVHNSGHHETDLKQPVQNLRWLRPRQVDQ